jgi:hypothetical protein
VDVNAEAKLTAQGRGGCEPADLGESGLGGAEGHVDGRCLPVARSLVAEPEGATDMALAGAPHTRDGVGDVAWGRRNGRGGVLCVY